jgi:hypothetical protein
MPKDLHIGEIKTIRGGQSVSAMLELDGRGQPVVFNSDDCPLTPRSEAFMAIALLPCMKLRVDCVVDSSVSSHFLEGLEKIQDVLISWKPKYRPVEFKNVDPVEGGIPNGNRVGLFFSGGVDSFYTLLKRQDEITDLIVVHGFDIPLDDHSMRGRVSQMAHNVGDNLNKRVVEVETNVRAFIDEYVFFGFAHGAVLASVGYLLSSHFKRFYLAAGRPGIALIPDGVHPSLDPHWSTPGLEFVPDGLEATRADKVSLISQYDIALRSLRVCLKNPPGAFNCGRCEKCLRTMIDLRVAGVLDRYTTFKTQLDLKRVYWTYLVNVRKRAHLGWSLEALEARGKDLDPELEETLRKVLRSPSLGGVLSKRFFKLRQKILGRKQTRRDPFYRR